MKFEVLKQSHLKRNILIGVLVVGVISAVVLTFTRAKYKTTQSIPLVNGTINYTLYDFKMIGMYQEDENGEYVSIDQVPEGGYALNEEESYCEVDNEKDNNIQIEYVNGQINFLGMTTKGTKCYLYFDENTPSASQVILVDKNISTDRNGVISGTLTTNTTGTVYSVEDDYGTSYVYAGAPTDNWVYFAGYYWRIIRINGDGSIRMIYNGTSTATTGTETQLSNTSAFNNLDDDNAYVGYMYGTPGSSSYSATHTNTNNSTIKEIVEQWYKSNIVDKNYDQYISIEQGFCNDRKIYMGISWNGYGKLGYGVNATTYEPASRFLQRSSGNSSWRSSQNPTLKCSQTNDYFTINGSSKGNKALLYPVGLITADEVVLAGGFGGSTNFRYYLYTNQSYWTMSPTYLYSTGDAGMFRVYSDGFLGVGGVNIVYGIRPVINLKPDVTISSGTGTSTDPYIIN